MEIYEKTKKTVATDEEKVQYTLFLTDIKKLIKAARDNDYNKVKELIDTGIEVTMDVIKESMYDEDGEKIVVNRKIMELFYSKYKTTDLQEIEYILFNNKEDVELYLKVINDNGVELNDRVFKTLFITDADVKYIKELLTKVKLTSLNILQYYTGLFSNFELVKQIYNSIDYKDKDEEEIIEEKLEFLQFLFLIELHRYVIFCTL